MRMEDTPYDAAMTRSKQELARQVVDCNARIEALEAALRHIAREGDHISRGTIVDRARAALAPREQDK
jgi:hypothetical protein